MPLSLPQRLAIAREVTRTVLDAPGTRRPFDPGRQMLASISAVWLSQVDEGDERVVLERAMRQALGAAKLGLSEMRPDPGAVALLIGECIGEVIDARAEAKRLIDAVRHSGRQEAATEEAPIDEPPAEVHVGADPAEPGGERQVVTITGDWLADEVARALVEDLAAETRKASDVLTDGGDAPTDVNSTDTAASYDLGYVRGVAGMDIGAADPSGPWRAGWEAGAAEFRARYGSEHVAAPPAEAEAEPPMSHEEVGAILDLVAPVVEEAAPAPAPDPPTAAPAPEPAPEPAPIVAPPAPPAERAARPPRRAPK